MPRSITIALFIVFLFLTLLFLRREDSGPLSRTRIMMGTVVEIRVYDESPERYDEAVSDAFAEMAAVEKLMSPHLPESEISRLSSASEPFRVSGQTLEVLQIAQEVTIASHGAFNAALGRLINLWGFAEGEPQLPADIEIEKALEDVGLTSFSIENSTVTKKSPQLAIDLGGVAKGAARMARVRFW